MNSNNLLQLLQTGFHASLGATSSLVETLQDPQKREQSLSELRLQLSERIAEWVQKGEITEQEARNFIETLLRQQTNSRNTATTAATSDTVGTSPTVPVTSPNVQLEIEELTAQIAAIRTELENLRNPGSNT